jgi:hypothetical protein
VVTFEKKRNSFGEERIFIQRKVNRWRLLRICGNKKMYVRKKRYYEKEIYIKVHLSYY